jgi:hypothetical protein
MCRFVSDQIIDLFSAIDKQVREKPSITSILFQTHHTVLAYLYPNCSRIVHAVYPICIGMKQGKATRKPVQRGI